MIKLIDALNLMDDFDRNGNPVPFQIKFFTMEGEPIIIEQGVKCIGKKNGQVVFGLGITYFMITLCKEEQHYISNGG